jgi:hypothetical protein
MLELTTEISKTLPSGWFYFARPMDFLVLISS